MKTNNKKSKCPSFEELSAYFDNELSDSTLISLHLKECEKCQQVIQSYKDIEDDITHNLLHSTPEYLSANIISAINRTKESSVTNKKFSRFNKRIVFKFAAMIAIVAISLLLFISDNHKANKIAKYEFNHTSVNSPKRDIVEALSSGKNLENRHSLRMPSKSFMGLTMQKNSKMEKVLGVRHNFINFDDFSPASTNSIKWSMKKDVIGLDITPVTIDKKVKQIWLVKELKNSLAQIKQNSKHIESIVKEKNGDIKINFKITKLDLVNLVRKLHSLNFKLLSPVQPQPEQKAFTGSKNDKVFYTIILTI